MTHESVMDEAMDIGSPKIDRSTPQVEQERQLRPTVEITKGITKRTTRWGWTCSCGDAEKPRLRKRDVVLAEARHHFDTKHGGRH
jgi:hypothetical protein